MTSIDLPDPVVRHNRGPDVDGEAAVEVVEAAAWRVAMPTASMCRGLTWSSTGQLATAKRVLDSGATRRFISPSCSPRT